MGDAPTVPNWTDAGSNVEDDAATPDDIDGALPSDADIVPPEPDGSGSDGDDGSVGTLGADPTTPNQPAAVERSCSAAHRLSRPSDDLLAGARTARPWYRQGGDHAHTSSLEHPDAPGAPRDNQDA